MKHIDLEQLILHYYGEPDGTVDRGVIDAHLAVCSRCRAERAVLSQTLEAVSSMPVPDRAAAYGQQVWQRLEGRLKAGVAGAQPTGSDLAAAGWKPAPQRSWWLGIFAWQRLALGGAVAALLVAAFLAGRFWPRPESPTLISANTAPISAQARDRVLLSAVADHMEKSEILLMELENANGGGGKEIDISLQREQAQELEAGSRLYEQAAQQAGETGISDLLGDLGRVLVVVAHSPSRVTPTELAELRSRIEGPGILFKLQVVDSGIEQRLKPEPERPGSRNVQD
jgi:hypothetical protein